MFHWISTLNMLILAWGLTSRFNRKRHMALMSTAFAIDLLLVLVIEIQRHAVENLATSKLDTFTMVHAGISLTVLILYGVMAYLGIKITKSDTPEIRAKHRHTGMAFVVFKLANYITSFYVTTSI